MGQSDNYSSVIILLGKYIKGDITASEKKILFDQFSCKESEIAIKDYVLSQLQNFEEDKDVSSDFESKKVFDRIVSELNLKKDSGNSITEPAELRMRIRRIIFYSAGIAAALAIAFISGVLYSNARNKEVIGKIAEVNYSEIKAPFGSQSEVTLPDGSSVLLNAGSSIKYRNDFNKTNRELSLHGEAYFKVSRNEVLPFLVSAGNINIMAVGTEFNVKAYDDEELIETTLVEGKVKITLESTDESKANFVDLVPNQKAIYIKETGNFSLDKIEKTDPAEPIPTQTICNNILLSPKVDVNQVAAWTEGRLVIRGEALENLCMKLQRKYDISFIFNNEEIKKYRFSGILLDETLEQVLNAIKLTAPIEYSISGKSVYLNVDQGKWNDFSKHMN
jgi:ferric-dicitrate binding protein FerR (iron transport regulator)